MKRRTLIAGSVALLLVVFAGLAGCDWRGPDPTTASVQAVDGPFAIAQTTVAAGNGFGGGTVYYPTDTSQGTFGAVAVVPGFLMPQSTISWYGPRVASQGFVVITIDTNSTTDLPAARGTELLAALHWLTTTSSVAAEIDPNRLAVIGWSMGGGGALEDAASTHSLRAAIGLAPWDNVTDFSAVTTPTLIVACQDDTIAPIAQHAKAFYSSIPATTHKAYLEIAGGDHFCVTAPQTDIARTVISWLKRWVDSDTRYSAFLCPPPALGSTISAYQENCPY